MSVVQNVNICSILSPDLLQVIRSTERPSSAAVWARRTAAARMAALQHNLPLSPRYGTTPRDIQLGILKDEFDAEYFDELDQVPTFYVTFIPIN